MIDPMIVSVNEEPVELDPRATIGQLLQRLALTDPMGMAVAVNQEVIPKERWHDWELHHQDDVLLIQATRGG